MKKISKTIPTYYVMSRRDFTILFGGAKHQCRRYINLMMRDSKPTHFLSIVKNTDRAITNFKRRNIG